MDDSKLIIGVKEKNNPGWLHLQQKELDLTEEHTWGNKFVEQSVTTILAEHVWEYLTYEEGIVAARICHKFLKASGYICCAVPDAFFPRRDLSTDCSFWDCRKVLRLVMSF